MADFVAQIEHTAVFGAPYSWTSRGIRSVVERFQQEYEGPGEPPNISYDGERHLFSMSTNERIAVNQFSKMLDGMILFSQRHSIDHTEDPLMLQLPGTSLAVNIGETNDYSLSINTLVDIVEDSDESSDDSSASGVGIAYWRPSCKNIMILSNEIALAISTITECYFYFERDAQRVKIVGAGVPIALEKLKNLEPLMECLYRHREGVGSRVTQNFLSFTSEQPGKGVEYVTVDQKRHYDRIVVPQALQDDLRNVLIGEERLYSSQSRWTTPQNLIYKPSKWLDDPDNRPVTERSKIWADSQIPSIGNAHNGKPRVALQSANVNVSLQASVLAPSKYLDPAGENRLRRWQQNIDSTADPSVPGEQPIEPEMPSDEEQLATKRVPEDSDSDDVSAVRPSVAQRILIDSDEEDAKLAGSSAPILLRDQKLFTQSDETRQRRANRPQGINMELLNTGKEDLNGVVQAASFYANVPRDLEESEDRLAIQKENEIQRQPLAINMGGPRRAFESDGANEDDHERTRQASKPMPVPQDPYAVSSDFDSGSYGPQERHKKAQRGIAALSSHISAVSLSQVMQQSVQAQQRQRPIQSQISPLSSVSTDPVPIWPGLVESLSNRSTRQDSNRRRTAKGTGELVHYADEDRKKSKPPLKPPPGMVIRDLTSGVGDQHLLDGPLDQIQRPSLKPMPDEPAHGSEENSHATSSSDTARSFRSSYVPQTKVSRPDFSQMNSDVLRSLVNSRSTVQKPRKGPSVRQHPDRIEEEDELSTRRLYNTMNLQAGNKGKKSGKQGGVSKNSQISKAQQALRNEFLPVRPQPATRRNQLNSRSTESDTSQTLSQSTLDAARSNPALASMHRDVLLNEAISSLATEFVENISPALNASRAFPGRLEFEMQIGQLMILPSARIGLRKVYEERLWNSAFASDRVVVKFTNILTNHGADVDGILCGKTGKLLTWGDLPGPARAILEFTCYDNTGQHFKLLVKENGSHVVTADPLVVSKVGIHCSGQVWDTCGVLSGLATWQASNIDLNEDIEAFVSTIYMKAGKLAMVYFRPPAKNTFAVSSVLYKRISLHDCQVPGAEGLQLKITEIKSLTVHSHRDDKKLLVAFEKSQPNKDSGSVDLHYEVAVIDERLNKAFEANQTMGVGDKLESTAELSAGRAQVLLDTALHLVEKIDWVGRLNYGNLVQMQDVQVRREELLQMTLPPSSRIASGIYPVNRPGQGYTVRSSISASSIAGPRTVIPNTILPGVRAHTTARLYTDGSGHVFYYGPGGAKIPYIPLGDTMSNSDILPGDSASQYGGPRRQLPRSTTNDDKPPGFW